MRLILQIPTSLIPILLLVRAQNLNTALTPFDLWPHQRVALKDVSIHLRYAGSGPPVLLVHGNPQHSVRRSAYSSTM